MNDLAIILIGLFVVGPACYGIARLTKTSPWLWLALFVAVVGIVAFTLTGGRP